MYTKSIIFLFCVLICLIFSQKVDAQQTVFEETTVIYKRENIWGAYVHTQGVGFLYRKTFHRTGFSRYIFEVEMASVKHSKEIKKFNPLNDNNRGYFYGKKNSVWFIRPSFGLFNTIAPKQSLKGVSISYIYSIGPVIAWAKPIYLLIRNNTQDPGYAYLTIEPYDENKHNLDNIYGRASWWKGLGKSKFYPGLYLKWGVNFDYSMEQSEVNALEAGMMIDAFPARIPIMAPSKVKNDWLFLNLYVNITFGNRFTQ